MINGLEVIEEESFFLGWEFMCVTEPSNGALSLNNSGQKV